MPAFLMINSLWGEVVVERAALVECFPCRRGQSYSQLCAEEGNRFARECGLDYGTAVPKPGIRYRSFLEV